MTKPNILFVMADQMTALALSIYGQGQAITPCLDALSRRGTVFENAYCNFPLCGPSRQSMMTGRLPSEIGAYDNAAVLAPDVPTYAHYLNMAGYRTCLSGKMHFVGPDQLHGFQERLTTDVYPADFSWTPNWGDPDAKVSFQNMDNVFTAGPCARSMQIDYDEDTAYQAERWLYDRARVPGVPWALTVSFVHPHDPYQSVPEFWDLYEDIDIELPTPRPAQLDAHSQRIVEHFSVDDASPTDDDLRRMRRGYFAAISYVDAKLQRLLDVLDDTGMSGNTIVIFTSDHGDMMGERGMFYKKTFFEWSARVPLIMAGAGVDAAKVTRPVSLVDILPTFCEIAGVDPMETSGISLWSQTQGAVYGEYLAEGVPAPYFMVREGDYKLLWSQDDPPVLFNLAHDPNERHDLADDPAYAQIRRGLIDKAHEKWNPQLLRKDIIKSQDQRRLVAQAQETCWDFGPDVSMKNRYVRSGKRTTEVEAEAFLPIPD